MRYTRNMPTKLTPAVVITALADALQTRHIKFNAMSKKMGKSPGWLSTLVYRKERMMLDDFLRVCELAKIDPVEILAVDGFEKYLIRIPLMELIDASVRRHLKKPTAR